MPIQRLLQNLELEPEDITRLVIAYEKTLRALRLVDRTDPIADLVARKVIEIVGTLGELRGSSHNRGPRCLPLR